MSLALFIYSPSKDDVDARSTGSTPERFKSRQHAAGCVAADGKRSDHTGASMTAKPSHAFAPAPVQRPRSLAFPSTIAVAILVVVLSVLKSALVEANSDTLKTISQNVQHCQSAGADSKKVTCPLDLIPGVTLNSARIAIETPTDSAQTSRCTLFARSAAGGQARGVSVERQSDAGETSANWLDFPKLRTGHDDFRYVVCHLATGSRVTGLEVTIDQQSTPSAVELKRMIKKQLAVARRGSPNPALH